MNPIVRAARRFRNQWRRAFNRLKMAQTRLGGRVPAKGGIDRVAIDMRPTQGSDESLPQLFDRLKREGWPNPELREDIGAVRVVLEQARK